MFFWCVQVDAAAGVEVDGEACRRWPCVLGWLEEEEEEAKRHGGKWKRPPGPIYKGKGISDRRENRGAQKLDM